MAEFTITQEEADRADVILIVVDGGYRISTHPAIGKRDVVDGLHHIADHLQAHGKFTKP